MSPAKRHPTGFVFTERALELDHEHRKRLRGGVPLTLSMRYLASALERLRKGTAPVNAPPTPRPPDGTIAITFVGHATVMITTPGSRVLVDPFLENSLFGVRRAKAAGIAAERPRRRRSGAGDARPPRSPVAAQPGPGLRGRAGRSCPPHCEGLVRRVVC